MKTEHEIAELNCMGLNMTIQSKEHLASCKREKEFLEDYVKGLNAVPVKISVRHKDLKKAIQTYDDGGVR